MSKLEYIREQIEKEIDFFTGKRNENRRKVLAFGVASASFSALATVAIGATKILSVEWLPVIALVSSAIATVVAVWETIFAHRKLWHINNVVLAELSKLKRQVEYKLAGQKDLSATDLDELFRELDRVLTEADRAWVNTYAVK